MVAGGCVWWRLSAADPGPSQVILAAQSLPQLERSWQRTAVAVLVAESPAPQAMTGETGSLTQPHPDEGGMAPQSF